MANAPLPHLLEDWKAASRALGGDADLLAKVEGQRERVARMKDPFLPIANNDPVARAKETVLFEDEDNMVIVDAFSFGPKALVVPKTEMLFPIDATADQLQRIGTIAAATSDAFVDVGATGLSKIWINPPSALTVRQLHVHVQPPIPRPSDKAALWTKVSQALHGRLDATEG